MSGRKFKPNPLIGKNNKKKYVDVIFCQAPFLKLFLKIRRQICQAALG
jgi:hypothetical protein